MACRWWRNEWSCGYRLSCNKNEDETIRKTNSSSDFHSGSNPDPGGRQSIPRDYIVSTVDKKP